MGLEIIYLLEYIRDLKAQVNCRHNLVSVQWLQPAESLVLRASCHSRNRVSLVYFEEPCWSRAFVFRYRYDDGTITATNACYYTRSIALFVIASGLSRVIDSMNPILLNSSN